MVVFYIDFTTKVEYNKVKGGEYMLDEYLYTDDSSRNIKAAFYRGKCIMHTPHIHSFYELYFCPESIAQRSVICGIEYEHRFPSAIISKPYTIHSMSCIDTGPTDFRRYVFYFNDRIVSGLGITLFPEGITDGRTGVLFRLSTSDAEYLERVITTVYDPIHPPSEAAQGLLLAFLIERLYALSGEGGTVAVGTSSYYVQNAMRYIVEHYHENIDADTVARHFSVSRSKLDRDFRIAHDSSPKEFITSCRINRAKYLLTTTDMSAASIAEAVGFATENYFYRFFKKHTGKTPSEYKKTYK